MNGYLSRNGHLSHLALERVSGGELNEPQITEHLASCIDCARALDHLKAHEQAFELCPPSIKKTRPPISVYGSILAAAAGILIFVLVDKPIDVSTQQIGEPGSKWTQINDGYRVKGGLSVEFFLERDNVVTQAVNGTTAHPGDRLGFRVSSNTAGHLMIAAIDGKNMPFLYYPQDSQGRSRAFGPSKDMVTLNQAVVLDDVLGEERLVALFCQEPFSFEELSQKLRATRRGESKNTLLYPDSCRERTITMTKKSLGAK